MVDHSVTELRPRSWRRGNAAGDRRHRSWPALHYCEPGSRPAWAWSGPPQQISNRLRIEYPNDLGMRVSHETIYLSIFQSARKALAPNLHRRLRTGRTMRLPAIARQSQGRGRIRDMVPITDRPVEVESRTSAGDWEGDLVMGQRPSAVATLVERTTRADTAGRFTCWGIKCGPVRQALTRDLAQVDPGLRRTLTWDRGREMAEHAQFTVDTGCQVYFCAPRTPWQRGSNADTNRLLRQYLPKTAGLRAFSQQDLDAIADRLNHRPRAVLGWRTPAQAYRVALDEMVNQPDSAEVRSG